MACKEDWLQHVLCLPPLSGSHQNLQEHGRKPWGVVHLQSDAVLKPSEDEQNTAETQSRLLRLMQPQFRCDPTQSPHIAARRSAQTLVLTRICCGKYSLGSLTGLVCQVASKEGTRHCLAFCKHGWRGLAALSLHRAECHMRLAQSAWLPARHKFGHQAESGRYNPRCRSGRPSISFTGIQGERASHQDHRFRSSTQAV